MSRTVITIEEKKKGGCLVKGCGCLFVILIAVVVIPPFLSGLRGAREAADRAIEKAKTKSTPEAAKPSPVPANDEMPAPVKKPSEAPKSVEETPKTEDGLPRRTDLRPGDRVEVIARLVCSTLELSRQRVDGGRPPGAANGTDVFGVSIGTSARVLRVEAGSIQVKMLEGNWPDRIGWILNDEARLPPSEAESEADSIRGVAQLKRREIFIANSRAQSLATNQADQRVPEFSGTFDPEVIKVHKQAYDAFLKQNQKEIFRKFNIDRKQLDAIEAEGFARKWPLGLEQ